jgi:mannosyltransferase
MKQTRPFVLRYSYEIAVGIATIAGLLLRLMLLDTQALWNDEMFSLQVATMPFGMIQQTLTAFYHHPPLFFYIAAAAVRSLGETAWALRLPPALFGAATIPVLAYCGDRLVRRPAGLIAALACIFSPFHLAYSQEGRPYALAGLLCLLSVSCFLFLRQKESRRYAVAFVLSTVALLYTHHWGIFVVLAECLLALFPTRTGPAFRKTFFLLILMTGLLYLPELFAVEHQAVSAGHGGWSWVDPPGVMTVINTLAAFSGSYFKMACAVFALGSSIRTIALGALGIFIVVGVRLLIRRDDPQVKLIAIAVPLIIFLPFIISFFRPEIFVWYRYTVIVFPLFCLLLGGLAATARPSPALVASLFVFLLTEGIGTTVYFSGWNKSNVKEVCEYVAATTPEADFIIRPKSFAPLFNYYYTGGIRQVDEAYLDQPLGARVDTARSFIYISLDVPNTIRDYMDRHFTTVARRSFPAEAHLGWVVNIYRQPPDSD